MCPEEQGSAKTAGSDASGVQVTVIRKYANRRLYNTTSAQFVTLEELHGMVKQGESFLVEDAKSGRDITCSVLVQIISEEEGKGNNMLSLNSLRQVLQAYNAGVGPQLSIYLEKSLDAFAANQKDLVQRMQNMFVGPAAGNAMEQFAEIGRQNLDIFRRSLQVFAVPNAIEDPVPDREVPSREAEIERLRQQVADIEKRLDSLSSAE